MSGLLGAIQFLTRVPIHTRREIPHARLLPWFPVVGVLIGTAVGAVAVAMSELTPPLVAATVAVIVGMLITGAFHEDGLADIADSFGGGWTVEQRLAILKDSRHGTYGVAALTSSVAIRIAAVASIPSSAAMFAGLVAAHTLGRTAALLVARVAPPASDSGLGASVGRSTRWPGIIVGTAAGGAAVAAVAGWWLLPLAAASAIGAVATTMLAIRKIGGIAGDVLGAVEQVTECAVLVVVSGLAIRHQLWWQPA